MKLTKRGLHSVQYVRLRITNIDKILIQSKPNYNQDARETYYENRHYSYSFHLSTIRVQYAKIIDISLV